MAPNVSLYFYASGDLNGDPLHVITDEDSYFRGLKLKPHLTALGGWEVELARRVGFAAFGSGTFNSETFVRILVHAFSDTQFFYGGPLEKRQQTVIHRDEDGGETFVLGGPGPKAPLERFRLQPEQITGAVGWNLDLQNGVWRWAEDATAGRIMHRLFREEEEADPRALPFATRSWNATQDSDGTTWADTIAQDGTYEIPIGTTMLQALWDLEDLGDLFSTIDLGTVDDPTYVLNLYQTFGEDVSGSSFGSGIGLLKEGVNITNQALELEGVALRRCTHVIVQGDDGHWNTAEHPSWDPGEYVKWGSISYPSKSDAVLEKAGIRWLKRQERGDQEITVELLPGHSDADGLYFPEAGPLALGNIISVDTTVDGSTHTPIDIQPSEDQLLTAWDMELLEASRDDDALARERSWKVKAILNAERGGQRSSPNQSSATSSPDGEKCKCRGVQLCPVHVEGDPPSEEETVLLEFNAQDDGGDALGWDGLLANQGPPGAAGSSHYYFKSGGSPDEYSYNLAACTPGEVLRISGWTRNIASTRIFKIGFFSSGTIGADVSMGSHVADETLVTNTPGSTWVFFSIDVEVPATATRFALGQDGSGGAGIDFDQITISTVVNDPGSGGQTGCLPEPVGATGEAASGDDACASRCDHVHEHGLLSTDGEHYHDAADIEGSGGSVEQPTITRYGSNFAGSGTSVVVTMPSAPAAGETLLLVVGSAANRKPNSITQTNVNWTERYNGSGNNHHITVYTGVAAASAGTTITVGFGSSGAQQADAFVVSNHAAFTAASAIVTGTAASGTVRSLSGATTIGSIFLAAVAAPTSTSYSVMSQSYRPISPTNGLLSTQICASNVESTAYTRVDSSSVAFFGALVALS